MNKLDIAQPMLSSLLTEAAKHAAEGKFTSVIASLSPDNFSVSIHVSDTPIPTDTDLQVPSEPLPPIQPIRPIEPSPIAKGLVKMEEAKQIIDELHKDIEDMKRTGELIRTMEDRLNNVTKFVFRDIFNTAISDKE